MDDNRVFGSQLAKFTRRKGHETETVCCAEGAKEYLSIEHYDLCIIETHLQNEKGFELLEQVNQQYPNTYTVPMTRSTKKGFFSHSRVAHEERMLTKPIKLESISKLLTSLNDISSIEEFQSIESY